VTAPTWPSVVAAVEHDAGCRSRQTLGASHPALAAYGLPCDCTRDARIGAGIAAALASARLWRGNHGQIDDAAAFAAFREASKPKEG
jgi:hypothetical protein